MKPPAIIIDTREQKPYRFPSSITKSLKTGDYSIDGLEDKVTVERKTKMDAYGTFGKGRQRFMKELQRLAGFDYSAIVIESSLTEFLNPPQYSEMNPKSAIGSVLAWSVKYNIHVFFTDNRIMGNALTAKILEKYWKYSNE